ncbi:MAG: HEAT repeat domain-containing protein [Planctomycetota bacterium]
MLVRALDDPQPLVRGHAAWALGRIGPTSIDALSSRLEVEEDAWVREELSAALRG